MKKLLIVLVLAAILVATLSGFGAVAAEPKLYVANSDVNVYVLANGGLRKAFSIPKTYYFTVGDEDYEGCKSISYGSYTNMKLYVRTADITNSASASDDDLSDDIANGAYTLPPVNVTSTNAIDVYLLADEQTLKLSDVSINYCYGIYVSQGAIGEPQTAGTYICANASGKLGTSNITENVLIRAADTNQANISLATVDPHPNSLVQTSPSEPTIADTDNTPTQPRESNVVRNIMIAVISVLCVVVIALIFKPTKTKKDRYELTDRDA